MRKVPHSHNQNYGNWFSWICKSVYIFKKLSWNKLYTLGLIRKILLCKINKSRFAPLKQTRVEFFTQIIPECRGRVVWVNGVVKSDAPFIKRKGRVWCSRHPKYVQYFHHEWHSKKGRFFILTVISFDIARDYYPCLRAFRLQRHSKLGWCS